ncbi:hypothetical protein Sgleb_37180 [Streptomyces glebosus]|uniref:Uncharacterized protein n=1 Tax=Streptomyces glebosus TaxID=249580 RepID=A0A640SZN4_9ACTN|nr:hypothetical protein Sgleb_37180 [Streptomyces glebosus]
MSCVPVALTITPVAGLPPMVTVAPVRLVPVIVTGVPPVMSPYRRRSAHGGRGECGGVRAARNGT